MKRTYIAPNTTMEETVAQTILAGSPLEEVEREYSIDDVTYIKEDLIWDNNL